MVKVEMLYQLDFRLQEITMKEVPFGGVSLFVFGDLMQLRPVLGNFIFENPKKEYKELHQLNPRWPMFESIILERNHRQGKDKAYADLLNRLRIGAHTEDDLEVLELRVRPAQHEDLKNPDLFIGGKRKECAKLNEDYIFKQMKNSGKLIRIKAVNFNSMNDEFKAKISDKDGTVGNTSFQDVLFLRKDAKIMIIHNVDTIDSITNGQPGVVVDFIFGKNEEVEKIIVKLQNEKAGKMNRQKFPLLASRYPDCVLLERFSFQYSIGQNDTSATARVIQFPLKLAHAVTVHKIQGATVPYPAKVVMDIDSTFEPAQVYVMLSRIQQLDQLFILKKFDRKKIKKYEHAFNELKRLEMKSFNQNPTSWMKHYVGNTVMKICFLNCAGLRAHIKDIQDDPFLLHANVLHFVETSLEKNTETDDLRIEDFGTHFLNVSRGKGIATYIKNDVAVHEEDWTDIGIQISSFKSKNLKLIAVYRSQNGNIGNLLETLVTLMNEDTAMLVTGDFNVCNSKKPTNAIKSTLISHGFKLITNECTHIEGGFIDHAYWRDSRKCWNEPTLERYSPYHSDHDALCITMKR